jgi:multidrug efflux pump subunit AcrA (membrane-fusion protein)
MPLDRPRFRRDLEAVPLEADGQRYIEVRDPTTGGSFRLYDFEYHVALAFDGLAFDKIIPWLKLATGLHLRESELREFAARLRELGFLEPDADGAPAARPALRGETALAEPVAVATHDESSEPDVGVSPPSEVIVPTVAEAEAAPEPLAAASGSELMSAASIEAIPAMPAAMPAEVAAEPVAGASGSELMSAASIEAIPAMPAAMPAEVAPELAETPEVAVLEAVAAPEEAAPVPAEAPEEAVPELVAGSTEAAPEPAAALDEPITEPVAGLEAEAFSLAVVTEEPGPSAPESEPAEPEPAPPRRLDSTAFPVLPTPPPGSVEPPPPRSLTPRVVTPPARPVPPSYVTPSPSTLGPLLVAQQAALRRRQRRSLLLFGSLGVIAAAAVLALVLPFFFPPHGPPRADVRTLAAVPGTVYRYFAGTGAVSPLPGPVMKFPTAGKVTRIVTPGTALAVGDIAAAVEAAKHLQNQLARQRERLAFSQQIAEAMHQVGNSAEEERQAAKVEERKARIAKILRALAQVAVVASVAGEVEETFTREGETVEAGSLALRLRSAGHRATFELPGAQAAEARRLAFCQVGLDGYVLDCTPAHDRADDARLSVEIPSLPAALLGRPARLVRARFDGAVALPAAAIVNAGRHHQVFVVSPNGRVEVRPVTVAEQSSTEAIVVQGLDAGENVILEPAANLRPGLQVNLGP